MVGAFTVVAIFAADCANEIVRAVELQIRALRPAIGDMRSLMSDEDPSRETI